MRFNGVATVVRRPTLVAWVATLACWSWRFGVIMLMLAGSGVRMRRHPALLAADGTHRLRAVQSIIAAASLRANLARGGESWAGRGDIVSSRIPQSAMIAVVDVSGSMSSVPPPVTALRDAIAAELESTEAERHHCQWRCSVTLTFASRALFAVILGLVICEPCVLRVFGADVSRALERRQPVDLTPRRRSLRLEHDLLGGIRHAAHSSSTVRQVVVVSSGLPAAAAVDLRTIDWEASPDAVAARLHAWGVLPSLCGAEVTFGGLGSAGTCQPPASVAVGARLAALRAAVCAGGSRLPTQDACDLGRSIVGGRDRRWGIARHAQGGSATAIVIASHTPAGAALGWVEAGRQASGQMRSPTFGRAQPARGCSPSTRPGGASRARNRSASPTQSNDQRCKAARSRAWLPPPASEESKPGGRSANGRGARLCPHVAPASGG